MLAAEHPGSCMERLQRLPLTGSPTMQAVRPCRQSVHAGRLGYADSMSASIAMSRPNPAFVIASWTGSCMERLPLTGSCMERLPLPTMQAVRPCRQLQIKLKKFVAK